MLTIPSDLETYLKKEDPAFAWSLGAAPPTLVRLTSQTWQGLRWRHEVTVVEPPKLRHPGEVILVVTGDRTESDLWEAKALAEHSGMAVATLDRIPNQPLWDLREDALIAYTFERFLDTGDGDWPLLFPMTKAVLRSMDALQALAARGGTAWKAKRFIITGMSKRGWTTWLAAASGDKRITGIAPMIYDNLNIPRQLEHQIRSWGKYSDMIADYTERGLQERAASDAGKRLASIVDPYTYRYRIKAPTLAIIGSNDPYWPTDASSLYWNDLGQPRWMLVIPNAGHGPGATNLYIRGVAAFARSLAGEFEMPRIGAAPPPGVKLLETVRWSASSTDALQASFADSVWSQDEPVKGKRHAEFVEYRYRAAGLDFSICSLPQVFEKGIQH